MNRGSVIHLQQLKAGVTVVLKLGLVSYPGQTLHDEDPPLVHSKRVILK